MLKRTSAPVALPITLDQAKLHLRVDTDDDDALIGLLIEAARTTCEDRLQRTLISTSWLLTLDEFPCIWNIKTSRPIERASPNDIPLPMPPLLTVISVQYKDPNGTLQTLAPTSYQVDIAGTYGRIAPIGSWPSTSTTLFGAVQIAYTAGYGPTPADVPAPIVQWLLLAIGEMYANREASAERPTVPLQFADRLLDPYKIWCV